MFKVQGIDHIRLAVKDVQKSLNGIKNYLGWSASMKTFGEIFRVWLELVKPPSSFSRQRIPTSLCRMVYRFIISPSA